MIDIAYVSIGALGGAAVGRASAPSAPPAAFPPACNLNSPSRESDLSLGIMKIPRLAARDDKSIVIPSGSEESSSSR
jgi:hypothetical protein